MKHLVVTEEIWKEGNMYTAGAFSFKYLLYLCEYNFPVGASCARDIVKKR